MLSSKQDIPLSHLNNENKQSDLDLDERHHVRWHEAKKEVKIDPEDPHKQLQFLADLDESDIAYLEKKHAHNQGELDAKLVKYQCRYGFNRTKNTAYLYSYGFFIVFLITTSEVGIVNIVKVFNPQAEISSELAYRLGLALSLSGGMAGFFTSSPKIISIDETLTYAYSKSASEYFQQLKDYPKQALLDATQFIFHKTITEITNCTGAILWISQLQLNETLKPTSVLLYGATISTILLLGRGYTANYFDENYKKGIKPFFNKKNPWLIEDVLKGNITRPLQILLRGGSAVFLRIYPFYYYLAIRAENELGWWPPADFISAVIFIHSMLLLYVPSYLKYMQKELEVNEKLLEQLDPSSSVYIKSINESLHITTSEKDNNKLKWSLINSVKEAKLSQLHNESHFGYVFKQRSDIIPLLFRTSVGVYFGKEYIATSLAAYANPLFLNIVAPISCGMLFGGALYSVNKRDILINKLHSQLYLTEEKATTSIKKSKCDYATHIFSRGLNILNAAVNGISIFGTAVLLMGERPDILSIIAIVAAERTLNLMQFNSEIVEHSVKRFFKGVSCSFFKSTKCPQLPSDCLSVVSTESMSNRGSIVQS